jgi:hypothetical protein
MKIAMLVILVYVSFCTTGFSQDSTDVDRSLEIQFESDPDNEGETQQSDSEISITGTFDFDANRITELQLASLKMLSDVQIQAFFIYRERFGSLIDKHELQAIPGWSPDIAKTVSKYLSFGASRFPAIYAQTIRSLNHTVLIRGSLQPEKSLGFENSDPQKSFAGDPLKAIVRYKMTGRDFHVGCLVEKDPGEKFQLNKGGFDFNSGYVSVGANKPVTVIVGDFTVNLGQGLVIWQNMAYRKSAAVTLVKREAQWTRAYHSSGEYNFLRGVSISFRTPRLESMVFTSFRRLTADTKSGSVSSINTTGLHRTADELSDKGRVSLITTGFALRRKLKKITVSLNCVYNKYGVPIRKKDELYNLFSVRGREWMNASADLVVDLHGVHVFGEFAVDRNLNRAVVAGLLSTPARDIDVAVVFRSVAKGYQSIFGNAFTDVSVPSNENGAYVAITVRPFPRWQFDMFTDVFYHPWVRYRVDGPSRGRDQLVQIQWKPSKKLVGYVRLKTGKKEVNSSDESDRNVHWLTPTNTKSIRMHVDASITKFTRLQYRLEYIVVQQLEKTRDGTLTYIETAFDEHVLPVSIKCRIQMFDTEDYDTRIYAYENELRYQSTINSFFSSGWRYTIIISKALDRSSVFNAKTHFSLRWGRTIYDQPLATGSGATQLESKTRSTIALQVILSDFGASKRPRNRPGRKNLS